MHVKGKVCVVTGAASGIGEAVARAYAEAGARGVVVADLKTSRDRLAKGPHVVASFAFSSLVNCRKSSAMCLLRMSSTGAVSKSSRPKAA